MKTGRDVKKQKGILGQCGKNNGITLAEELKNDIINFMKVMKIV